MDDRELDAGDCPLELLDGELAVAFDADDDTEHLVSVLDEADAIASAGIGGDEERDECESEDDSSRWRLLGVRTVGPTNPRLHYAVWLNNAFQF